MSILERIARLARGAGRRIGRTLLPPPAPVPVRIPSVERTWRRTTGRPLRTSRFARLDVVMTVIIGAASAAGCTQRVELKRSPFITPLPEGQRQALAAPAGTAAAEPADGHGSTPTTETIALEKLRGPGNRLAVRPTVRTSEGSSAVAEAAERVAALPRSAEARLALARAYHDERIFDLAGKHYEAALELAPDDPEIARDLARLWVDSGAPTLALSVLNDVIRAQPQDADAWKLRGAALDRLRRHTEAETAFHRAVTLAPARWDLLNDLGYNLVLQERYEDAARTLRDALRLAPGEPVVANNLGLALALAGETEAALVAFRAAGDESLAWNNLGVVHRMRGRTAEAAEAFERAARLAHADGSSPELKESQAVLQASRRTSAGVAMGAGIVWEPAPRGLRAAATVEEPQTNSQSRGMP